VIRTDDSTLLRQQLVVKELENQFLRRQVTAKQQQIEQLEARLKQYENPNTPPSKQGGAASSPSSDGQTEDEDEEPDEDDAGGDSDAASDSSPGRNKGHEGTTRPAPEPEETIQVEQGFSATDTTSESRGTITSRLQHISGERWDVQIVRIVVHSSFSEAGIYRAVTRCMMHRHEIMPQLPDGHRRVSPG